MPSRRWYRSLYWRIALGLFAFLVLTLVAQGALFFWMLEQTAGSLPARSPRRVAALVASDIATALSSDPNIDLSAYVLEQYGHVYRSFVVVMRDGRVVANTPEIPDELRAAVDERSRTFGPLQGPPPRPAPGRASELPPERPWETAPIFVNQLPVGRVAVLTRFPSERIRRELGPTMAAVGAAVLAVGVTLIALGVFGPVRRRLKAVQTATEQLGAGDVSARAPEQGGDEVAAVARSFNRMADELAARAGALEAANRARRQLLADVSHELMTPLTAMRGYVETLAMQDVALDAATRHRYLSIIEDETHRLERIVGDLLDLAKLEGGGGALRREVVNVAALFDRVRERHERESAARRIEITARVESGAGVVEGDPDRLEQALQNLAANALRHTPDGGHVVLSSRATQHAIVLEVRDNGPGIPTEHLPLIFDRFYKADAARRAAGGSGLGLSIVKTIVERHGGRIAARNDGGAVFEISLPRQRQ
jgi:two-component system OmpR family sensor kinase